MAQPAPGPAQESAAPPVATTNGMGMAAMLRAMTFCMANTHSVFANAHDDVHVVSPESWHL